MKSQWKTERTENNDYEHAFSCSQGSIRILFSSSHVPLQFKDLTTRNGTRVIAPSCFDNSKGTCSITIPTESLKTASLSLSETLQTITVACIQRDYPIDMSTAPETQQPEYSYLTEGGENCKTVRGYFQKKMRIEITDGRVFIGNLAVQLSALV